MAQSEREKHHLRWCRTTVDGRPAVYGVAGSGPPLLFLHGWGLGQHAYKRGLSRLVARGCFECGFCEQAGPSRNITTTPRQRISLRREMERHPDGSATLDTLLSQYEHDAVQTCAGDSSCAAACPVGIDTGALMKDCDGSGTGS